MINPFTGITADDGDCSDLFKGDFILEATLDGGGENGSSGKDILHRFDGVSSTICSSCGSALFVMCWPTTFDDCVIVFFFLNLTKINAGNGLPTTEHVLHIRSCGAMWESSGK